jgi:hypothetical protein
MNNYPIHIFRPSTIKHPYGSSLEISKSEFGTAKIVKRKPLGRLDYGVTIYNGCHGITFRDKVHSNNQWLDDLVVAVTSHNKETDSPNLYIQKSNGKLIELERLVNIINEWYNWCAIHIKNIPVK